jgi:uncharacterized membrane protein
MRDPVPDSSEEWRRPSGWEPWEVWAVTGIIALAALLRFHEYTQAPLLSDNQDALQFGWSGLTLITQHTPYAWDSFRAYQCDFILHANATTYCMVHPWLGHPPLFSILVGGWAYIVGARSLLDVTPEIVRPVAIALGLVSMALAYVLGRRVLGARASILGLLLLAVSPGAVLLGREVETEALMAPLLLLALILVHRIHTGEGGRLDAAGVLLCCLLLPLVKVSGVVIAGGLAVVLISSGRWRLAAGTVAAGAAGFGLYAAWGALFDFQLWLNIIAEWQTHHHGVMAGLEYIVDSAGIGRGFRDGWWPLGWIALGAMILRGRHGPRPMLLATTAIVYAAGIALLGDVLVQGRYGWYRIVLYPIIYLAAGYLTWASIKRPSVPGMLLVVVLGGATAVVMITGKLFTPSPYAIAVVVAAGLLPAALSSWRRESARWLLAAQLSLGGLVAVIVITSVIESWNLATIYTQI